MSSTKEYNNYINNSNFCNNCGKLGHSFHQCKHPIISVGIILVAMPSVALAPHPRRQAEQVGEGRIQSQVGVSFHTHNDDLVLTPRPQAELLPKLLMIRRKDSIGYVEFMRGKYPIYNKLYIQNIISEMTVDEKNKIINCDFDTLWRELWGDNLGIQYRGEEKVAREKFESIKLGINSGSNAYNFKNLVDECTTRWTETEWGFPKGRHNNQEKDLLCALREFEEETGYSRHSIKLVQNLIPFEEIFTGSNYKSYKHKYYLATITMDNITDQSHLSYQKSEVSKMEWKTYDEAINLIRPYNLEKKDVLTRVNKLLSDYRLYP
jgi:8-oxo-dGTP pyrophosphatase MutT (NUDIX family)